MQPVSKWMCDRPVCRLCVNASHLSRHTRFLFKTRCYVEMFQTSLTCGLSLSFSSLFLQQNLYTCCSDGCVWLNHVHYDWMLFICVPVKRHYEKQCGCDSDLDWNCLSILLMGSTSCLSAQQWCEQWWGSKQHLCLSSESLLLAVQVSCSHTDVFHSFTVCWWEGGVSWWKAFNGDTLSKCAGIICKDKAAFICKQREGEVLAYLCSLFDHVLPPPHPSVPLILPVPRETARHSSHNSHPLLPQWETEVCPSVDYCTHYCRTVWERQNSQAIVHWECFCPEGWLQPFKFFSLPVTKKPQLPGSCLKTDISSVPDKRCLPRQHFWPKGSRQITILL